jgi:hypothetical protein
MRNSPFLPAVAKQLKYMDSGIPGIGRHRRSGPPAP